MVSPKKKSRILKLLGAIGGIVFAVALFTVAIIINNDSAVDDATKILGAIDIDNGDEEVDWSRYPTYNIELSESLTITEPGTYHITGSLSDGNITLNIKNTVAKLQLDNVSITNSTGPAIICNDGIELVIELIGRNNLSDGVSYSSDYDMDVTGVIYSKADVTLEGSGTLNVNANYADGIVGKDDVKFADGNYIITAKDDAIRGKNSVYFVDGSFSLISGADGVKATNETEPGKGFVLIEDGSFSITASAKGIKSTNSLMIYAGRFIINSFDDALHSNNYVGIIGGTFDISSGDDGIHANSELIIDGGQIDIKKAYEGLEAQAVTINGGDISVVTTDDGINAGGGADQSGMNRKGAGPFNIDEKCVINLNNGSVHVNSGGDGIDSNGYLYINGGNVIVDGPTNNGNGALDSEAEIKMSGGDTIAIGASGMAKNLGSSSSVYNLSVFLDKTYPAGTVIDIRDENGNSIITHTSLKTFSHISAGSIRFSFGGTYSIYLNNELYQDFTIYNTVTTIGNFEGNFERK